MQVLVVPSIGSVALAEDKLDDAQIAKTHFTNIRFVFADGDVSVLYEDSDVSEFDFVWLTSWWSNRDLAHTLSLYLTHKGTPHTDVEESGSKLVDQMVFGLNGIPVPDSFFVDSQELDDYVEEVESVCGYPIVIKDTKGSRGRNTFLAKDRQQLHTVVRKLKPHRKYIYQQYIPNDYDWGVLVSNGEVVATEKSYGSDDDFRNNACNGAEEVFTDISECPDEVKAMAVKAAEAMNLDWCRSDIIVDKDTGKPSLLEVNRYPGITKGTDEEAAVITHIQRLLSESS